jgi:thiol-disulfide isomerase/thioredoxin
MKSFLKKNWSALLLLGFFSLLMIPQTGLPIRVFVQRLIMMAPSEVASEERVTISNYNWELQTLEGGKLNFSDSEAKVVLLNFWASWCPPCVAELPSMQNLYNAYGDAVDFYFVTAEDAEKVKRFLNKKGYTFPVYIERQPAPSPLQVSTIPTTFLISANGRVIIQKTGAARWDSEKVRTTLDGLIERSKTK